MIVLSLVFSMASALDLKNQQRLAFEHLLYISDINTVPSDIAPGSEATLSFNVENTGSQFVKDVRIALELPDELAPYRDVTTRKIAQMDSGEIKTVSFRIIPLPEAKEGIYKIGLVLSYLNYVGDERQENETVSLVVGTSPELIVEIKSSDIYQGNLLGNIKLNVINDNVGDIKFLKVTLEESDSYKIIGADMDYIGDLKSDDFSDVSFKVRLDKNSKSVDFPVTLKYKDSLNRDYEQKAVLSYPLPTPAEAGIIKSKSWMFILLVVIIVGAIFMYKRKRNKAFLKHKKALYLGNKF